MTPHNLLIRILEALLLEADNERRITLELWMSPSDLAVLRQSPEVREGRLWTSYLIEDPTIPPLHARAVRGASLDDLGLDILTPASSSVLTYLGD